MHRRQLPFVPMLAVLLAACSSAGSPATPTPTESPVPATSAPAAESRIEVSLTDALRIEPADMTVTAGTPVTFVVTNTGVIDHEFYLGDEAAQAEHEQEMQEMGGMAHDEEMGISVAPGQTKELTVTLPEAGSILAGCHVAGHYDGGMKATITVTE